MEAAFFSKKPGEKVLYNSQMGIRQGEYGRREQRGCWVEQVLYNSPAGDKTGRVWDYEFNEIQEPGQRGKGSGRLEGSWEMLWPSQRPTALVWYPVLTLETVPPSAALASGMAWEPVEAEG